jgi:hypothetical protein
MRRRGTVRRALACAIVACAGLTVAVPASATPLIASGPGELLPDLDPAALPNPSVNVVNGRAILTFTTLTENKGAGPLVLRGRRGSTAEPQMVVDQVIGLSGGGTATVAAVGTFAYDVEYERWGFAPYITYELHRAAGNKLVRKGPQSDFCVDDRLSDTATMLPGEPASPVFRDCGEDKPSLLALDVGISVGWGNRHLAGRKGQAIDITGLGTRKYILVQHVDAAGMLRESNDANNSSSILIQLTRKKGQLVPKIRVLKRCPDKPTCKA